MYINEDKKNLPVSHECDVLVCGGGVAGIAAALAAARGGKKVILLEREYVLGGLATIGLITTYLPICDGIGHQVSFGIAEELLRLSVKHGFEKDTPWLHNPTEFERTHRRFAVTYNPHLFALEAEKLLLKEGVYILYGTLVCNVLVDNKRITHAIIENKSGRSAIKADSVVDTTGDADVCKLAGAETATFAQGNVPAGWYYSNTDGVYQCQVVGAADIPDSMKSAEQLKLDKSSIRFGGLDGDELSKLVQMSHDMTLNNFFKKGEYSEKHTLATMTTIPQIRMTRRICGCYTQDDSEIRKFYDDSVGMFADWRKTGPAYELPYRTLYGNSIHNLIAAGRCISGTDAMWDITRVIPVCAVSGQAAGTAAAIDSNFAEVDVAELQKKLRESGVVLHFSDLK